MVSFALMSRPCMAVRGDHVPVLLTVHETCWLYKGQVLVRWSITLFVVIFFFFLNGNKKNSELTVSWRETTGHYMFHSIMAPPRGYCKTNTVNTRLHLPFSLFSKPLAKLTQNGDGINPNSCLQVVSWIISLKDGLLFPLLLWLFCDLTEGLAC